MRIHGNAEKTAKIKGIEGNIIGLLKQLSQLSAHPDQQNTLSPLFTSLNTSITPAADYDGMMGSIAFDAGLSEVFSSAGINDNYASAISVTDKVMDFASEMLKDQEESKDTSNNKGRGQGTIALGEHKTICNQFNNDAAEQSPMALFYADLDDRMQIEHALKRNDDDLSYIMGQDVFDDALMLAAH